jgi:hypothetical protein
MSYGSGPRLPAEVDSNIVMCPMTPWGPQVSSIKKSLAVLPVQLVTHVPNAHVHVSKALDIRAIIGLQDVRAGSASTMNHSPSTATVPSNSTARCHTADRA